MSLDNTLSQMELVMYARTTKNLILTLRLVMIHSVAKSKRRKRTVPVRNAQRVGGAIGMEPNVSIGNH